MSIYFRTSKRSLSYQDVWGRGGSTVDMLGTGVERQLRLFAVYAATKLVAEQGSSFPMRSYRENADGSRHRLPNQPKLCTKPARFGSVFDWKFRAWTSLLLRGNAVGMYTSIGNDGYPDGIEWLNPDECSCDENDGTIYYQGRPLIEGEFIHIPGYVLPGKRWGYNPLQAYALTLDTALYAQQHGVDWFQNGTVPGAILQNTEKTIVKDVAQSAKESFRASMRAGDLFVTGKDWKYDQVSVSAADAQFLDSIKASANQIAAIYGVPPERIGGEAGGSLHYSTREQDALDLSQFTLRPSVSRFEEAFTLIRPPGEYIKCNMDAIARADLKTRYEAHAIALSNGWRSRDEVRIMEDEEPLPNGEGASYLDPAAARATPTSARQLTLNQTFPAQAPDIHVTTPERSTTINVDATTAEGAVQVRNEVDGTSAVLEGAVQLTLPPAAVVNPGPTTVRKKVITDDTGRITDIIETVEDR